jgi:hypothetical protein
MTDTLNVLPHLRELEVSWRKQNFQFTKQQQEEYNLLLQARRDRVAYFYENDLVSRGSKITQDKLDEENK